MAVTRQLSEAYATYYVGYPGVSQRTAWDHEVAILHDSLSAIPEARRWGLVMEYELPFEGGRRVDKLALAAENVLALEFKDSSHIKRADLDQVRAYARDLSDYHSACRNRRVEPVLVLAGASHLRTDVDGATVVGADELPFALRDLAGHGTPIDIDDWLRGSYAPLPTLIDAARSVFRDEPLPAIRRAEGARIPELLKWLHRLVADAQRNGERHLVLITGVPGAGKTLVGLQFVHEYGEPGEAPAMFLSGNDPLVALLQYVLKSRVFVRPMRSFIQEYGIRAKTLPTQHVLVFDEAQRAWDLERMRSERNVERCQPEILVDLAAKLPDWAVIIGLVGEGQEIYLGEESGLGQWRAALDAEATPFQVHVPPHLESVFDKRRLEVEPLLNLTLSLRTHRATDVQEWVSRLMDSDIAGAGQLAPKLLADDYDLYVTTDIFEAKSYLYSRYADAPEKRFGLLASSKSLNLPKIGIDSSFRATSWLKVGPWYSAPATDPNSCCQLKQPVTEFQCQGLELDLPVVCWGDDLWWEDKWVAHRLTRGARDSAQLRLNSYRVLLTRGRDGTIIFVPPNLPDGQQDEVVKTLIGAGARAL